MINILFKYRIHYLSSSWNFECFHFFDSSKLPTDTLLLESIEMANESLIEGNIFIYHFISSFKPWKYPNFKYSEIFWEYARKTSFYEEILFNNLQETMPINSNSQILQNKTKEFNKVNGQLKWARAELKKVRSERLDYKKEVSNMKCSKSYRLGRFLTFLPRTLRNIFTKYSHKKED